MVLQNYQKLISNMIYIVALGVGLKCPRKIHLNTQWGVGGGVVQCPLFPTALQCQPRLQNMSVVCVKFSLASVLFRDSMYVYICIWKQIRIQKSNCDKMMVNFLLKSLISNLLVVCESAPWSSLLASHPEFGFIGKMQLEEYSEYNGKFDFIFLS